MTDSSPHMVAVVQHPPTWLDRVATLERAAELVGEAARGGARLVAFPEAFVPGFPFWVWELSGNDADLAGELYARLLDQAVDLAADDLRPLRSAARAHGVTVVCGVNERERAFSGTTLYNTAVVVGPDGRLLNRHRKLVPTNAERLVWAPGDAAGLRPTETPSGRVGALICWENYMPLARYALFAQGLEVYVVPTWANDDRWVATMRHIAFEGRCWVLGAGNAMTVDDVPAGIPGREKLVADYLGADAGGWINDGDSVIAGPDGELLAGPLRRERGILYAACDPAMVARKRYRLDVAGHYARPDVFRLQVRREAARPIELTGGQPAATGDGASPPGDGEGAIDEPAAAAELLPGG